MAPRPMRTFRWGGKKLRRVSIRKPAEIATLGFFVWGGVVLWCGKRVLLRVIFLLEGEMKNFLFPFFVQEKKKAEEKKRRPNR